MKKDIDYLIKDLESLIRAWRTVSQENLVNAKESEEKNYKDLSSWHKCHAGTLDACAKLLEQTIQGYSESK